MTPTAVSQQIWTPYSTVPVFRLGNNLVETLALFISEGCRVFRIKIQMGMQKMKLQ